MGDALRGKEENEDSIPGITFSNYRDESQLDNVMRLVGSKLSEPYSVFTYRYFLHQFPDLCIFALPTSNEEIDSDERPEPIGCIVCKIDTEKDTNKELLVGYLAMLAVDDKYRRCGIGTELVKKAVRRMKEKGCTSIILETEKSNLAAMKLYEERFGFIREELLVRYYLHWGDAYRLRLWLH